MSRNIRFIIFLLVISVNLCVLPNLPNTFSAYDSIWVDDLKTAADPYCPSSNCANEDLRFIKYIKRMGSASWGNKFQRYNFNGDNTVRNLIQIH